MNKVNIFEAASLEVRKTVEDQLQALQLTLKQIIQKVDANAEGLTLQASLSDKIKRQQSLDLENFTRITQSIMEQQAQNHKEVMEASRKQKAKQIQMDEIVKGHT